MSVTVTDLFTGNEAGERTRTFRGGDRIVFNLFATIRDVPPGTRVRATYYLWGLNPFKVGSVRFLFHPFHKFDIEHLVGPGPWVFWATWRIPGSDPMPRRLSRSGWNRLVQEHWRMRNWPLRWEFHGFVGFTEPPRGDQWDDGQPPWRYDIRY